MVIAKIKRHDLTNGNIVLGRKVLKSTVGKGVLGRGTRSIRTNGDLNRLTNLEDIIGPWSEGGYVASLGAET